MSETLQKPLVIGNTQTGTLKIIAFICMIMDHTGVVLFPQFQILRLFGRLAFPLFAWCLVVGVEYTRDIKKYMLRLLLLLVISQPFYMLALHHPITKLNIFAPLFLSLLAIYGIREKRYYSHIWMPILVFMVAHFVQMDYGYRGILFILLLYAARKTKSGLCAFMIAYCLFWTQSSSVITNILGISLKPFYAIPLFSSFSRLQMYAVFALPFMLFPFKKNIRMNKFLSYSIYPLHLLILHLLSKII